MRRRDAEAPPVVELGGQLDAHTVEDFRHAVREGAIPSTGSLVLDLAELTFVDTGGVAAISDLQARIREHGGDVVLVGVSREVRRTLELAQVAERFDFRPSASG